jgi:5-methylcytosine-specific restriction endonuclease McrA
MDTLHKRCSKCSNVLPISEFYVKIKATGRRFSWCRTCHAAMCGRVPIGVPSRLKPPSDIPHLTRCRGCKVAKSRSEFPHQFSAYCSACVESYDQRVAQKRARDKHRVKHGPAIREAAQRRYREQPDKYGPVMQRAWRAAKPELSRAAVKRYRDKHKDVTNAQTAARRARILNAEGSYTAEEWQEIKRKQDHRCVHCNKREPEIKLTVDHIVPLSRGGSNYASNLQGLCQPCNSKKSNKLPS